MKILFDRRAGIGDVIMLTSIIKEYKKLFPNHQIFIRTKFPELFHNNPHIDGYYDNKSNFDEIIDFNHAAEPATALPFQTIDSIPISEAEYLSVPRIKLFYKRAKIPMPDKIKLDYFLSENELNWARNFNYPKPIVAYCLNSNSFFRTYPVEQGLEVMNMVKKIATVLVCGKITDLYSTWFKPFYEWLKHNPDIINCVNKLTLRETISILSLCDLLISPDNGLVHISNAINIPCLGLFTNVPPHLRIYGYDNVIPLYKILPCSTCFDRTTDIEAYCPSHGSRNEKCVDTIGAACGESILPEEIFELTKKVLNGDKISKTKGLHPLSTQIIKHL